MFIFYVPNSMGKIFILGFFLLLKMKFYVYYYDMIYMSRKKLFQVISVF